MGKLIVHNEKVQNAAELIKICPFGAMEDKNGKIEINAACRLCKMCVKRGAGVFEFVDEVKATEKIDKSTWKGIAVYVDHVEGKIHPITYELIGKARELAAKINQNVYAVFIGENISGKAQEILHYGVDKVYVCDKKELRAFNIENYTTAFALFIKKVKPAAILVGATPVGRQLAPRVAAHFHTGLTADCTILDIHENTDLIQIRPAFGGNIMAEILTTNHRPQIATVRYKIMDAPKRNDEISGNIELLEVDSDKFTSKVEVLSIKKKPKEIGIENADILVVAGRGVKKKEDLNLIRDLAEVLNGDFACTRPLVESGWLESKRQIGLSGRTVRPKLIITCGVSGSVQFVAGMEHSEEIFAINTDPKASIFKIANYAIVGDLYEIIPKLIEQIKQGRRVA